MTMPDRKFHALIAVAFFAACSSSPSDSPDAGDATDSGKGGENTDGSTASPDGKAPAMHGAVSMHLTSSIDDPRSRCSAGTHWVNGPSAPTDVQFQRVTAAAFQEMAVDGNANRHVSCAVKGDDSSQYSFAADMTTPAINSEGRERNPVVVHLEALAIRKNETVAPGTISVKDDATSSAYAGACTFSVASAEVNDSLGIASGRIWAHVVCNHLPSTTAGDACGVDVGFLVFENCATK